MEPEYLREQFPLLLGFPSEALDDSLISLKVVKILIHNSENWKRKASLKSDQANAWGKALSFSGKFLKIMYSRVHKSQV